MKPNELKIKRKKFLKHLMTFALTVAMVLGAAALTTLTVHASSSGSCGDGVTWTYSNGVLTISKTGSGTGAMEDSYSHDSDLPWDAYRNDITSVVIGSGVTHIGRNAFYRCGYITSVEFSNPCSVTSIGYRAFGECLSLTSVTIPSGVTSIPEEAFYYCRSLTGITIPSNITTIGAGAFRCCFLLETVTIPAGVTSIGDEVFKDCNALTAINVANGNQYYSSDNGVLFNKNKTVLIAYPDDMQGSDYSIPNGVTEIASNAFKSCRNLRSVTVPASVMTIGEDALYNVACSINVASDNNYYSSEDGVLFNKAKTVLIRYPGDKSGENYIIPGTVTQIQSYAFVNCQNLTHVSIPDDVTAIGEDAFTCCYNLIGVNIPTDLISISNFTFYECNSLTGVTIPDGVTAIGKGAFERCTDLAIVAIPDSVTSIGDDAFADCNSLTKIIVSPEFNKSIFTNRTCVTPGSGNSYTVSCSGGDITGSFENHNFTYTASGSTITATCSIDDCEYNTSGITLTIAAPTKTAYGDGESASARLVGLETFSAVTGQLIALSDIRYAGRVNTTYEESNTPPTGVGDYTATITVAGQTVSVDYTIGKGTPTPASVTAKDGYSDGTAKELVTVDSSVLNGGTMYYALGQNSDTVPTSGWNTSIPVGTAAQNYYVWYKVAGDSNHENLDPVCVTVVLRERRLATVEIAPAAIAGLTENGSELNLVTEGSASHGRMYYTLILDNTAEPDGETVWSSSVPTATRAGTYYVWYKVVGDEGYVGDQPDRVTVIVSAAQSVNNNDDNNNNNTDNNDDNNQVDDNNENNNNNNNDNNNDDNNNNNNNDNNNDDNNNNDNNEDTNNNDDSIETTIMFRLYNPNSGEHFYTGSEEERDNLTDKGWNFEGNGWIAPVNEGAPVYRLYNPNAGDHHYTMDEDEKQLLTDGGWTYEGVAWNSVPEDEGSPLFRLYNPNAYPSGRSGAHHYTMSDEERDNLIDAGWSYEGLAWYGM